MHDYRHAPNWSEPLASSSSSMDPKNKDCAGVICKETALESLKARDAVCMMFVISDFKFLTGELLLRKINTL